MKKNNMTACPLCKNPVEIDDFIEADEILFCSQCSAALRVVSVRPPRLKEVGTGKKRKSDFESDD